MVLENFSGGLHINSTADLPAKRFIHRKWELEHGVADSHDHQRQHENGVEGHETKVQRESFSQVHPHARNRRILQILAIQEPRRYAVKRMQPARAHHETVSDGLSLLNVCVHMIKFSLCGVLGSQRVRDS